MNETTEPERSAESYEASIDWYANLLGERNAEVAALEEKVAMLRDALVAIETDTDDDHLRNWIKTVLDA